MLLINQYQWSINENHTRLPHEEISRQHILGQLNFNLLILTSILRIEELDFKLAWQPDN